MMRMLRFLRLMVCVACIAAFASGCGGGGGGGTAEEMPPVMECPEGQIGTYPDCMDPPSTDEQRIAAARQTLASIVTNARSMAQTASSAAAQVELHADATVEQIDMAFNHALAAQAALTVIEAAGAAANAATTPAEAELALEQAQAALDDLIAAQSAAASIQSAVEAVASQRQQMQADVAALTNNSSLIQHVRANKLLSDALLEDLVAARLLVGPAGDTVRTEADTETCTAPCATFPANSGTGATAVTGQRTAWVGTLISNSNTPLLTGTGRLPHGFDLEMESTDGATTTFINAYTDITQTRLNVRTKTNHVEDTSDAPDDGTTDLYENRDFPDTDYLVAGIWMTVNNANLGESTIQAFAYGKQPILASFNFCSGIEQAAADTTSTSGTAPNIVTTTTVRTCAATEGLSTIAGANGFVEEGKNVTATYTGDANGAYIAGGETSYFTGSVELTAEFQNPITQGNPTATDGEGSIQGAVTNITAGGQQMAGSIELQKHTLGNDISAAFAGNAVGVVDGKSFGGDWTGQFFNMRYKTRTQTTETNDTDPANIRKTIETTYTPDAPGSVAGAFYVKQLSNPTGDAAFIGAFGAHRP